MSLLNDLLKQLQGGVAQVNPFDGGADYQSVTRPKQAVRPRAVVNYEDGSNSAGRRAMDSPDDFTALPRGVVLYEDGSSSAGGRAMDSIDDFIAPNPNLNRILGAIDPRRQVLRGNTPYSPGEGPRTRF